jgi:hypothetical protein
MLSGSAGNALGSLDAAAALAFAARSCAFDSAAGEEDTEAENGGGCAC